MLGFNLIKFDLIISLTCYIEVLLTALSAVERDTTNS